jgi:hypothetical protein
MGSVLVLTRRCAWCSRVWTAAGWAAAESEPLAPEHETSTICTDCVSELQQRGVSM